MTKFRRRTALGESVAQHVARGVLETPKVAVLQEFAREKTEAAITVLAAVMLRETSPVFARVAAANAILDRGWGKPVQPLAADAGPLELLHRIERVIVHPEHSTTIVEQIDDAEPPDVPQLILPPKKKLQ